jgi:hypothetical protein
MNLLTRSNDSYNEQPTHTAKKYYLLNIANVFLSSPILVALMMDVLRSPETSVLTRATQGKISVKGILDSHRRQNLKSYIALTGWAL